MAEAIIAQQDLIAQAVQRLIIENGCTPTQISFSNVIITASNGGTDPYVNSNTPSNGSCLVFDPRGGGIQYVPPPAAAVDATHIGQNSYGQHYFFGGAAVKQVGSQTTADLIVTTPYINLAVATEMNAILGLSTVSSDLIGGLSYSYGNQFTGAYNASNPGFYGTNATNVYGKTSACVYRYDLTGPTPYPTQDYECFKVLIVQ